MSEIERATEAQDFVHAAICPRGHVPGLCPACPSRAGVLHALWVLDEAPRDLMGARAALHDAICMSPDCGPDSGHADRTQGPAVDALRKFRAAEAARS